MHTEPFLVGVTFAVSCREFLEATNRNQACFDARVLVTAPDDGEALHFAKEHASHCVVREDMQHFVGTSRGRGIEIEMVERLLLQDSEFGASIALQPRPVWVVIVPPTTLLPANFREEFNRLTRDRVGDVFRVSSAIYCATWGEFFGLARYSKWKGAPASEATHDAGVILFRLGTAETNGGVRQNRAPRLPITTLNVAALPFGEAVASARALARTGVTDPSSFFQHLDGNLRSEQGSALLIGDFEPQFVESLLSRVKVVYQLRNAKGEPGPDFRGRVKEVIVGAGGEVSSLGISIDRFFEELGVICIDPMNCWDLFPGMWRQILQRCAPETLWCGISYGFPHYPTGTVLVELFYGRPAYFDEEGYWAMPIGQVSRREFGGNHSESIHQADGEFGIIVFIVADDDAAALSIALAALRNAWDGPILVQCAGTPTFGHRVACYRSQAILRYSEMRELFEIGDDDADPRGRMISCSIRDIARARFLGQAEFDTTLNLSLGSLLPDIAAWRARTESVGAPIGVRDRGGRLFPATVAYHRSNRQIQELHSEALLYFRDGATDPKVFRQKLETCFAEDPVWQPDSRGFLVSEFNAESLVLDSAVSINAPPKSTIITACRSDEIEVLRRNWNSIRWPEGCRLRIYHSDADGALPDHLFPSGAERFVVEDHVFDLEASIPYWLQIIAMAAKDCRDEYLIYLDPCFKAFPGANLFAAFAGKVATYVSPGWQFVRMGNQVRKIPKVGPPATCFNPDWLRRALLNVKFDRGEELERHLFDQAVAEGNPPSTVEMFCYGWL